MDKKAFTLIELLIVVAIIGLLGVGMFVAYGSSKQKSRDAKRASDIAEFTKALGLYINEKGSFPIAELETCLNGTDVVSLALKNEKVIGVDVKDPLFPSDPAKCYRYQSNAQGSKYTIKYNLETTSAAGSAGEHRVDNE